MAFTSNDYVGLGAKNANETKVAQSVALAGHITAMYCSQGDAATANRIYTLRLNFADAGLTCTILLGQTKGFTLGALITIVPGDLLDVKLPSATDGSQGSFSLIVGP